MLGTMCCISLRFFITSVILTSVIVTSVIVTYTKKEAFTSINDINRQKKKRNLILLGDSILKNNAYVNPTYSVEYLLKQHNAQQEVFCLAKDGAGIATVYKQLANIPDRLNTNESVIFLSIGGNDLLQRNSNVDVLLEQYITFVNDLQLKCGQCKITLLNLYIPPNLKNSLLRNKIQQWNRLLKEYALKNNMVLIPLDTLLYEPNDFVDNYEPSEIGGMKIVKALLYKFA
jgi:hypothetical protein